MTLNQNQFGLLPIKGMMSLRPSLKTVAAQIDSTEAGELVAGQAVKLVDSAGGVPKVIAVAADSDVTFGFIAYNQKNAVFVAGDQVEVATGFDDCMYMEAASAIGRGDKLMVVVSGSKVDNVTAGKPIIGYAYDKAASSGDLIRVILACPAYFVA